MRRTKIVCTIGPASDSPEVIAQMLAAGMNVARLNASHGTWADHERRIRLLQEVAARQERVLGILLDTQGPKLRIGEIDPSPRWLRPGEPVVITSGRPAPGEIPFPLAGFPGGLSLGDRILLSDGLITLTIEAIDGERAVCRVVDGGELRSRKGVSLPGVNIDLPAYTEADAEILGRSLEVGIDLVAASFTRRAAQVIAIRELMRSFGREVPIIAKIENAEGVQHIDEILEVSDGIMVARGDLGVQIPVEEVPLVQKMLINRANEAGRPVITATEMLESMVKSPRPTRAEVTDVANAVFDGTDALMLSGETAIGAHPVEAVRLMARVAARSEDAIDYAAWFDERRAHARCTVGEAIARASSEAAQDLGAAAIVCSTQSGTTARLVSRFRPRAPILAITPYEAVMRQLSIVWGVMPFQVSRPPGEGPVSREWLVDQAIQAARAPGLVKSGDTVVIAAAVQIGTPGSTNLLQVYIVP